eukprot:COSAG05_NODE_1474_length_4783_cov_4.459863_5_plen_86_part_00
MGAAAVTAAPAAVPVKVFGGIIAAICRCGDTPGLGSDVIRIPDNIDLPGVAGEQQPPCMWAAVQLETQPWASGDVLCGCIEQDTK